MITATRSKNRFFQHGFSLIELMVATTLGLLLSAAVVQVYLASKTTFRSQNSLSDLQESGRFAIAYLSQDIRMAGFMGCPYIDAFSASSPVVNNITAASRPADIPATFDSTQIIRGFNDVVVGNTIYGSVTVVSSGTGLKARANTDVLLIRRGASPDYRLASTVSPTTNAIQYSAAATKFVANDVVIVSDCLHADIFSVSSAPTITSGVVSLAHDTTTNTTAGVSNAYNTDSEVMPLQTIIYYVGDTGDTTPGGGSIYALYMLKRDVGQGGTALISSAPVELVRGVENMQLVYGIDTTGDGYADSYSNTTSSINWSQVVSVQVNLLLQGLDDNVVGKTGASQQQAIQFNGGTVTNNDGRMRQVFSTVVAIRNRIR